MKAISRSALLYALWELSRRAGVPFDFFQRWKIEFRENATVIRSLGDAPGVISFPREVGKQGVEVVRKAWMRESKGGSSRRVADLVVPFCGRDSMEGQALFVEESPEAFCCTENLLCSLLFTLCRREEIDSAERDVHGRFP